MGFGGSLWHFDARVISVTVCHSQSSDANDGMKKQKDLQWLMARTWSIARALEPIHMVCIHIVHPRPGYLTSH